MDQSSLNLVSPRQVELKVFLATKKSISKKFQKSYVKVFLPYSLFDDPKISLSCVHGDWFLSWLSCVHGDWIDGIYEIANYHYNSKWWVTYVWLNLTTKSRSKGKSQITSSLSVNKKKMSKTSNMSLEV